jgi:hypothetical protein
MGRSDWPHLTEWLMTAGPLEEADIPGIPGIPGIPADANARPAPGL